MIALLITTTTMFSVVVHEFGALLRQREALRSLERLAERHPDSAALVAEVIEVGRPSKEPLGAKWRRDKG